MLWHHELVLHEEICDLQTVAVQVPENAKRRGLLMADISGGQESTPIPVVNDKDSTSPPELTYIRSASV